MRIAVVGAGGVGGYVGGRLALAGEDVTLIARGRQLAAMRDSGLRVHSVHGNFQIVPVQCTDDPATVGPVDLMLFTVKLWETDAAARMSLPLIGERTTVISLQNGVEAEERLATILGVEHVLGGIAQITSSIAEPGLIVQTSAQARIILGELSGSRSARAGSIRDALDRAGIDASLSDDITRDLWSKLAYICAFGGVCAVTRMRLGVVLQDPDTRTLFLNCIRETVAVAQDRRVLLPSDLAERHVAFAETFGAEVKPSMLNDLERGGRLEVDWLNGAVVRMGRDGGIPTPANWFIWTALKLHAATAARPDGSAPST
ncbi:MAG: 2-dehydropantoate 2-reductase [Chloroflexi bacterium]|nr:2-dehydropantoate 2-reductase [Chloroflexota bacterium]